MESENKITVLDFGGQYSHLIVKRIRHLGVYSEIKHPDSSLEEIGKPLGIVLSGGPSSVYSENVPPFNPEILEAGIPILGLCYGMQLMAHLLGGEVKRLEKSEYGRAELEIKGDSPLFSGIKKEKELVWMSHGDSVVKLPEGFVLAGSTDTCTVAAIADEKRNFYGIQFHPEVKDTPSGDVILSNFLKICGTEKNWSMEDYIDRKMEEIRNSVGERNVFLLVSGGVDSTVTFTLLNEALGEDKVLGLHIDTGFMRKNETSKVMDALSRLGFNNLMVIDSADDFRKAVEGIVDPQEKRKAIGDEFIYVKDRELARLDLDPEKWLLGQGTLYPDIIESGGSRHSEVIKTHHNRTDLIKELVEQGKVVEPLDQLYKDEVREVGERLGLPHDLVWRHPFPGPGIGVRVLCSKGGEKSGDYAGTWVELNDLLSPQGYNSVVLPVRSVGVQGDCRTYAHPAAIEGELDWKKLEVVSTSVTNSISGINRVVLKTGGGMLKPLESFPVTLTRDRLDLLREADEIAMKFLREQGIYEKIFQMPVVLLPVASSKGKECIVIRPLESTDVMTARFYHMAPGAVMEITDNIMALGNIEYVFYDITNKPPGTFEWE